MLIMGIGMPTAELGDGVGHFILIYELCLEIHLLRYQ